MSSKFTNRLIKESSPYLRQHAHNPVDWYPWGSEALSQAKELNLPILVSIGYSACHWCHVMEHESFENEEVAAYMNEHFINIKIDREERPDLDHIYMDAVQAISGSGGWPLNVFLTPDTRPFYGGTYFPPVKAFNRASWIDILTFISDAWNNKRGEILQQAKILLEHIQSSGTDLLKNITVDPGEERAFTVEDCGVIAKNLLSKADPAWGGFGAAPKFPQTFTIQYLMMYGSFFNEKKALDHSLFSLKKMLNGGIYDQLAGGMARYSTDTEWLAPHFEKMLYDNALLVCVLSDAYQVTGDNFFKSGIEKTLHFLINEMKHPEGGFYAALDADTEGVEGKFYVWDKVEIDEVLKEESAMCCEWYGVTERGNWEGKNILHVHTDLDTFAKEKNINADELDAGIKKWNEHLLSRRNARITPSIDDKILLGWNALLITAFCKASAALNNDHYRNEAVELFDFILSKYRKKDGGFFHTYKDGQARHPAFLDDYANLLQACILLQEITCDQRYLVYAENITGHVISHFSDPETGMFFYTSVEQNDVLVRKKEFYDGAVPSGNSQMAESLFYLAVVFDNREWKERAYGMVAMLKELVLKYPGSFGIWASIILKQNIGIHEIAITGTEVGHIVRELLQLYLPNKVLMGSYTPEDYPLLVGKNFKKSALIYLCKNYSCSLPVENITELKKTLN